MPHLNFKRITSFTNIGGVSESYESNLPGVLGLAPYLSKSAGVDNFVFQLKEKNVIGDYVVAMYFKNDCETKDACSHIKFGSYDQNSIKEGE
jgi:hypothetical protein